MRSPCIFKAIRLIRYIRMQYAIYMKTIRKVLFIVILSAVVSAVVFFFGWTQFSIPAGKYGVMLSKSGGYHQKLIIPGQLTWRWERLIPTNARIFVFDLAPRQVHYAVDGVLPAAEKYSKVLNIKESFAWSFSADALAAVKPEYLAGIVSQQGLQTQEALEAYTDARVKAALQTVAYHYISDLLDDPYKYQQVKADYQQLSETIKEELDKEIGQDITLSAVTLSNLVIPDIHTYKLAEQSYNLYEQQREQLLAETAAKEAQYAASEQFQIDRLTKWGEFLAKYPHIIELIAVAQQDSKAALNALKSLEKTP